MFGAAGGCRRPPPGSTRPSPGEGGSAPLLTTLPGQLRAPREQNRATPLLAQLPLAVPGASPRRRLEACAPLGQEDYGTGSWQTLMAAAPVSCQQSVALLGSPVASGRRGWAACPMFLARQHAGVVRRAALMPPGSPLPPPPPTGLLPGAMALPKGQGWICGLGCSCSYASTQVSTKWIVWVVLSPYAPSVAPCG